jgi:hypothetical protein
MVSRTIKRLGMVDPQRIDDLPIELCAQPSLALIDNDDKGMPTTVATKLEELGGLWPALVRVVPELALVAWVGWASTGAGLFNARTGEKFVGSGGVARLPDG